MVFSYNVFRHCFSVFVISSKTVLCYFYHEKDFLDAIHTSYYCDVSIRVNLSGFISHVTENRNLFGLGLNFYESE